MYHRHTYGTAYRNYTQRQRQAMAQIHGVVSSNYHTSRARVIQRITLRRRIHARLLRYGTVAPSQGCQAGWRASGKGQATVAAGYLALFTVCTILFIYLYRGAY